jgi:GT2 family glycosyltransferase
VEERRAGAAVVAVVLTYRPPEGMLEAAVDALLEDGCTPIVVDNGGGAAQRLGDRPVELLRSPANGGYGAGMNLGLRAAFEHDATHVALLNDDVVAEPGWLGPVMDGFTDRTIGAVQPLLVDESGSTVNSAGVTIDPAGQGADLFRGEPCEVVGTDPRPVVAFTGGAVVVSRDFVDDVGGFDERFFLYYEDVELSRRGARAGWRYRVAPSSRVRHFGSATTVGLGDRTRFLQERNRLWSSCMHGSAPELARGVWLSVRRLRHPPRGAHARALGAGLAGGVIRLVQRWRGPRPPRRRGSTR